MFAMICYIALHLYRRFPCPGYKEEYPEEEIRSVFRFKSVSSALYSAARFTDGNLVRITIRKGKYRGDDHRVGAPHFTF